jgi:hypothetical protein
MAEARGFSAQFGKDFFWVYDLIGLKIAVTDFWN